MIPKYNLNNMCRVKTKAMGLTKVRACVRWGKCGFTGIMENKRKKMWGILKWNACQNGHPIYFLNASQITKEKYVE
jgi:hypothetical protein